MTNPPRILLLSPYDAMSHQYWRIRLESALVDYFHAKVTTVTLPARYFSWRFRGNSLTLSEKIELDSHFDEDPQAAFDLIIATSITDLATLKGLRADLQSIPAILYFHENQFAYPEAQFERQIERQITSIYSAMAADCLVFNSQFNQRTFLEGARQLLSKMPDGVPMGVVDQLQSKSRCISVPIDSTQALSTKAETAQARERLTIVWNHRWEHDKGLAELKELIELLLPVVSSFTLHLIGQQFRNSPSEVNDIKVLLAGRLGRFGFIENRVDYLQLLADSDIVLSTARHEFQGIAVLEAMQLGCRPIVPDDLAYQEFIPSDCRYSNLSHAVEMLAACQRRLKTEVSLQETPMPESVSHEFVLKCWVNCVQDVIHHL